MLPSRTIHSSDSRFVVATLDDATCRFDIAELAEMMQEFINRSNTKQLHQCPLIHLYQRSQLMIYFN
jgi:hypothetical protein